MESRLDIAAAKKRYEAILARMEAVIHAASLHPLLLVVVAQEVFRETFYQELIDADLPTVLEALEEAQANQHESNICVPKGLYDEANVGGRQLLEAVIPLLDAIRGCDNEIVLEVVRPHSGIVGDIIDRILRGSKEGDE